MRVYPHNDNRVMAFSADQVARLAGISRDRLRYWERTDAFIPVYVERHENGPFRRIYTFHDLVGLRAIARLRLNHDVPLQEVRNVTDYLREHRDASWSQLAVRVYGHHLVFRDPVSGQWMAASPAGQLVFELRFDELSAESERDARALMKRDSSSHGKVTRNRNVMSNAWVLSGTRIPVSAVLSFHHEGYPRERILAEYPTLVAEDIDAAIAFEGRATA